MESFLFMRNYDCYKTYFIEVKWIFTPLRCSIQDYYGLFMYHHRPGDPKINSEAVVRDKARGTVEICGIVS